MLKISDLGMSRETDEIYVQKRTGRVPLKWMAIESIIAREFTSASDIWSYGVVLWEIGTLGNFKICTRLSEYQVSLIIIQVAFPTRAYKTKNFFRSSREATEWRNPTTVPLKCKLTHKQLILEHYITMMS